MDVDLRRENSSAKTVKTTRFLNRSDNEYILMNSIRIYPKMAQAPNRRPSMLFAMRNAYIHNSCRMIGWESNLVVYHWCRCVCSPRGLPLRSLHFLHG